MGHSLLLVLVPPDKTYSHVVGEGDFRLLDVMLSHDGANKDGEFSRFRLDPENSPPEPAEDNLRRWKMTHRQARLEILGANPDSRELDVTPETSLEELADIRNQRRKFSGERYWVEDGYVCAESPANPFPKFDCFEVGGVWADDFADPPRWERPKEKELCLQCDGRGHYPVERKRLPLRFWLTRKRPADDGLGDICNGCDGVGFSMEPEYFEDVPLEQMHTSVQKVLAIIEHDDDCWPCALLDEKGVWHGAEAGGDYGVPEEGSPRETLENVVSKPLRKAPEGTTVIVIDIQI